MESRRAGFRRQNGHEKSGDLTRDAQALGELTIGKMQSAEGTEMGIELSILGLRKINSEEVRELTGKTRNEMQESKFFRAFYPDAPYDSWYWSHSQAIVSRRKNVMHLYTPVTDANGDTVYVIWVERLGYYWDKDPYDSEQIDSLLEDVGEIDWHEGFHIVAYDDIRRYTRRKPSVMNPEEELVTFIYG